MLHCCYILILVLIVLMRKWPFSLILIAVLLEGNAILTAVQTHASVHTLPPQGLHTHPRKHAHSGPCTQAADRWSIVHAGIPTCSTILASSLSSSGGICPSGPTTEGAAGWVVEDWHTAVGNIRMPLHVRNASRNAGQGVGCSIHTTFHAKDANCPA